MNADVAKGQDSLDVLYRRYLSATVLFHLAAADRVGLGATDYQASNLVDLDGPLSNGELARRLGLSTGATTRLVDRLEAHGLVRRTVAADDRRRAVIAHTGELPAGLDELLAAVRAPIGAVVEALSAEQRDGLRTYLDVAARTFLDVARSLPDPAGTAPRSRRGHQDG